MDIYDTLMFSLIIAAGLYPILHPNTLIRLIDVPVEFLMGVYIPLSIYPAMILSFPTATLSFLAASKLYREGYKLEVILVWITSAILGGIASIIISTTTYDIITSIYWEIYEISKYLIPIFTLIILLKEGKGAFILFAIYSAIGLSTLATNILHDPLFVLFSGFFAIPSLLGDNPKIKNQKATNRKENMVKILFISLVGVFLSFIFISIPGMGSPSTAIALLSLLYKMDPWYYISINASYLSSQTVFSFFVKEIFGHERIGVVAFQEIFNYNLFLFYLLFGSFITLTLYPIVEKLYVPLIKYVLGISIVYLIVTQEGLIGLFFLIISSISSLIHRYMGFSAFPFFGAIITPVTLFKFGVI